jgi:hypothetical protein
VIVSDFDVGDGIDVGGGIDVGAWIDKEEEEEEVIKKTRSLSLISQDQIHFRSQIRRKSIVRVGPTVICDIDSASVVGLRLCDDCRECSATEG